MNPFMYPRRSGKSIYQQMARAVWRRPLRFDSHSNHDVVGPEVRFSNLKSGCGINGTFGPPNESDGHGCGEGATNGDGLGRGHKETTTHALCTLRSVEGHMINLYVRSL